MRAPHAASNTIADRARPWAVCSTAHPSTGRAGPFCCALSIPSALTLRQFTALGGRHGQSLLLMGRGEKMNQSMTVGDPCQATWVFHDRGRTLVAQAYGDLTAGATQASGYRLAEEASRTQCHQILVDLRPAVPLLSADQLLQMAGCVTAEVGFLVRECDQSIAFRHALMMAMKGVVRMYWTDPFDALEWCGLECLPPFRKAAAGPFRHGDEHTFVVPLRESGLPVAGKTGRAYTA